MKNSTAEGEKRISKWTHTSKAFTSPPFLKANAFFVLKVTRKRSVTRKVAYLLRAKQGKGRECLLVFFLQMRPSWNKHSCCYDTRKGIFLGFQNVGMWSKTIAAGTREWGSKNLVKWNPIPSTNWHALWLSIYTMISSLLLSVAHMAPPRRATSASADTLSWIGFPQPTSLRTNVSVSPSPMYVVWRKTNREQLEACSLFTYINTKPVVLEQEVMNTNQENISALEAGVRLPILTLFHLVHRRRR